MSEKMPWPSSRCSKCGKAGHLRGLGNSHQRCRCGGTFLAATTVQDFTECPSCNATGRHEAEPCVRCDGCGYVHPNDLRP